MTQSDQFAVNLSGKVAVVTGAAKGIGASIATAFSNSQATVVVSDIDDESGRRLVERLDGESKRAIYVRADVSDVLSSKPSEYFLRQCFIATDPDENALKVVIDEIGDDRIVVSTDYPHDDSLFLRATESFLAIEGVNNASKRKILWDNCARLYQIPTHPSVS